MNATNLYVTTCRLVMQADPENRDTWTELYKLLPYLRQSLSCTVCGKLLSEPYTPTETSCQHHVCRKCLGGKKRLKPTCSWCKDYSMYVDNVQIKLVLQCYRKLCEYIKFTPIYCKLCSIYNNGGQFSLTDMIEEAIDNSNNRCDETNSVQCEEEIDSKENISVPQTSETSVLVTPINTSHPVPKQPLWPLSTQTSPSLQSTPSTVSLGLVHVSSQPINSAVPPAPCLPTSSINSVKAVISTPPPVIQTTHHFPLQTVAATTTTTTTTTTTSGTSGSSVVSGTIIPSTNMIKHGVVKEVPYPKHNSSVNNGSSMYSVMYADGDSTKITIKRKPPDIDSNNKSVPIEQETVPCANQELIKKPKPKPKPKPKRKGCRCGNATPTPGKLTCCGQRCPCYVEAKACIECRCRGCRNPHRPGGKKVRPVIPQLANIQIHQVQPVHGRSSSSSITNSTPTTSSGSIIPPPTSSAVITNTTLPQTIRAVQAMHAVQAVSSVQAVAGSVHQLISLGGGMVQTPLSQGLGVNPMAGLAVKPVSLALTSVPAQLLINDDRSTSNSASDNSDVDVDT